MSKLLCPSCGSENILVSEVQKWWVNRFEFYCHSSKQHDSDADVECYECEWTGIRYQLNGGEYE